MTEARRCAACGELFAPRPQTPDQRYCSALQCQRQRKYRWHKERLQSDPDYRQNQIQAQVGWASHNPDYWREYRNRHIDYTNRNRELQRIRNRKRSRVANMDASNAAAPFPSGLYRLLPVGDGEIAKMAECTVHLTFLALA
ncbi:hypothetical protein [Paraburkholderia silvatlantica]|uniref:hypothetical protein n=1 Tax=Paraburkholderia silvatlantica TaxID=321895 RepID=UPI0037531EFF